MNNLTNQVLKLQNGKNYFVVRQAAYRGVTYYFGVELTADEEDFTNNFLFFERIEEDGVFKVKKVKDPEILKVLSENIKLD